MPTLPVARIEIQDVKLAVVFIDLLDPLGKSGQQRMDCYGALAPLCAARGLTGDVIAVWQDSFGRTRFLAPPQQHLFFQAVSYGQLRAQVNDWLTAPD